MIPYIKGRNERELYADIIEAMLKNDCDKAKELLCKFLPDELAILGNVANDLDTLSYLVWSDYPVGDE